MRLQSMFSILILLVLALIPWGDSLTTPSTAQTLPSTEFQDDNIPPAPSPNAQAFTGAESSQDGNSGEILSLSGSRVKFDPSVGGASCYDPAIPQTFCFLSETFTTDWEYVFHNWLKFPESWEVSDVYIQGTPVCDNGGTWGTFSWEFETAPYEVKINHARYQSFDEHCVATYCVDLIPAISSNPASISWYFSGDGYGNEPHWPCSYEGYTPEGQEACDQMWYPPAYVSHCQVDLLSPATLVTSGCKGVSQSHTYTLTNNTAADATFALTYTLNYSGTLTGPAEISLASGASIDIDVELEPHSCLADSVLSATIQAATGLYSDTSTITKTIYSQLPTWEQIASDPLSRMDGVLAAYDHKVWGIIGNGSTGVSSYNPDSDSWTTVESSSPPFGEASARSGCQIGSKVYIYGNTSVPGFTGLWSYDIASNTWTQESPAGTAPPFSGVWAPAWVADEGSSRCYLTGGATSPGGGNLASVYVYDAAGNQWLPPLPDFSTARDFHAAYLFERAGNGGKHLCVAGGITAVSVPLDSTQCYDFFSASWNTENADLGQLPLAWWGMGYTMRSTASGDQLWMVNGVDEAFQLHGQNWFYDLVTDTWRYVGPLVSGKFYRTSSVTLDGNVYHVGGSTGGFTYSGLADKIVDVSCPACQPSKGEWVNIGLGHGCPDFTRYDAEYFPGTGQAYILGGRSGAYTYGNIYAFDPVSSTCSDTGVEMPVPISNYSIATLQFADGYRLCTFGGRDAVGNQILDAQCYRPTHNDVVSIANLPSVFTGYLPGAVEVVNNRAYIFGGFSPSASPSNLDVTYEYNPTNNTYIPRGNLGLARGYIFSAVVDGMIYAFGGDTYDGFNLIPENKAERFDPNSATWDDGIVPDLPQPSSEGRAFGFSQDAGHSLAGKIVLVGGGQWPDNTAETLLYDPNSQTYDSTFPDLNAFRRNHAAFFQSEINPRMWVMGGRYYSDSAPYAPTEFFQINQQPVCYDNLISTEENTPVTIPLNASDPDNDPLTFNLVDEPEHGNAVLTESVVQYTPADNYFGPDSFTFRAHDGEIYSNTATISISIAAQPRIYLPLLMKH
jgi:hypothetical protein